MIRSLVLLSLSLFFTVGCMGFFYYPDDVIYSTPQQFDLKYEEHWITTHDNLKLHAWYFPTIAPQKKGMIVQFHGNAENLTSHFHSLVWVLYEGYDLFIFDYRGYGKSQGSPSPEGLRLDSLAAITYAKKVSSPIILWGQSLGGAILLDALTHYSALQQHVAKVVIESSFISYQDIGQSKLAGFWLTWPFQSLAPLLLTDEYSAKDHLKDLKVPILVIHGDQDRIVGKEEGERIYANASDPKELLLIKDADHLHVSFVEDGRYRQDILRSLAN